MEILSKVKCNTYITPHSWWKKRNNQIQEKKYWNEIVFINKKWKDFESLTVTKVLLIIIRQKQIKITKKLQEALIINMKYFSPIITVPKKTTKRRYVTLNKHHI